MTTTTSKPRFNPGVLLLTRGASEAFERNGQTPLSFFQKHCSGDWGNLCDEDRMLNDQALVDGSRLLSAYTLKDGTAIWIITEATDDNGQRAATTILKPEEY